MIQGIANHAPMFEVDRINYYRKVGDEYVLIEGPVDTTPIASGSGISPEESDALEGLLFSEHDINLFIKGELTVKILTNHLNAYILQAYRMGQPQPKPLEVR